MFNKVIRVILGIVIGIAVLVGIFFILPGKFKQPIVEWWQDLTDDNYKTAVSTCKDYPIANFKDFKKLIEPTITFDDMLSNSSSSTAWVCEKSTLTKNGSGTVEVKAYGFKNTVQMDQPNGSDAVRSFTDADVIITFKITMENKEVTKIELPKVEVDDYTFEKGVDTEDQDWFYHQFFISQTEDLNSSRGFEPKK